uniref:Disintegrin-like halysetin (Trinotate prediction) n=1 Tax=Henneguya salminicola TaxID=69463 RepID=A0A6G3MIE6_HENSL
MAKNEVPFKSIKLRLFAKCGDGVVDGGEECDCGPFELCHNITSRGKGCNHKTCKFTRRRYQCTHGQCCNNFKFTKSNLCRASIGECDITEYCDGKSSACPADRVKQNYDLCNYKPGFCYSGNCVNMHKMCQLAYSSRFN